MSSNSNDSAFIPHNPFFREQVLRTVINGKHNNNDTIKYGEIQRMAARIVNTTAELAHSKEELAHWKKRALNAESNLPSSAARTENERLEIERLAAAPKRLENSKRYWNEYKKNTKKKNNMRQLGSVLRQSMAISAAAVPAKSSLMPMGIRHGGKRTRRRHATRSTRKRHTRRH